MDFMKWAQLGGFVPFNFAPDFRMGGMFPQGFYFEGEGGGGGGGGGGEGGDPPADPPPGDPPGDPTNITQKQLNDLMAKEKSKHRDSLQKHLDRVVELEKEKGISDTSRASLAIAKSELEEQLMTEKERATKEKERLSKEHGVALSKETARADTNWGMFEHTKKTVAISNAAVKHKAYRPEQLALIVGPDCQLIPIKAEGSDEVIDWRVIVKAEVKKEDGTSEVKAMTVDQYVELLKGKDDYANLFLSDRPSGTGFRPGAGPSHAADPKTMSGQQKVSQGLRELARRRQ